MDNDDDREVIDAEVVEIPDSSDNLPAVMGRIETERPSNNSPKDDLSDWRTEHLEKNPDRRCQAHLSDGSGQQCRKWAIRGSRTCATHGSSTKAAKLKAQERLDMAGDRMVAHLLKLARFAESEAIQLKATDSAIDRTLGKATQQVVLTQGEPAPWEQVFDGITTISREESRRARGVSDASDDIAGLNGAHLHASSQDGATHHSSDPPDQSDTPQPDNHGDSSARRDLLNPTTDTGDHHGPRDSAECEASDSPDSPMHREGPRRFDRERDAGPPARHITGDEAIRQANAANRQIGALPPPRELESPHKRYPRP